MSKKPMNLSDLDSLNGIRMMPGMTALPRGENRGETILPQVLFVESHSILRDVLSSLLDAVADYHIVTANDGLECLEKIPILQPDLIITGLRMLRMSGFELIQAVRNDPNTAAIPIIVLSTWSSGKVRERALTAGANAYFELPVEISRLVSKMNEYLDH